MNSQISHVLDGNVEHDGDTRRTGFLFRHLFIIGLLLAAAQKLLAQVVSSRENLDILHMIQELMENHLQALCMIIRYQVQYSPTYETCFIFS